MSFYPIFLPTDSYKFSHYYQYPPNTEYTHFYMETRSHKNYPQVYFWGLNFYLSRLNDVAKSLFKPTQPIGKTKSIVNQHGVDFNEEGFIALKNYVEKYKKFPLKVMACPENKLYPIHTPLATFENTEKQFFWLPSFLETYLLKVWYPITIATKCYFVKELLLDYWQKSSDSSIDGVDFQFHNFGDRGSSSTESAFIGGMAHLQLFKGTDNFMSSVKSNHEMIGFSIPAMEHSTVTCWGKKNEFQAYRSMLEHNKGKTIIAMVLDSYDLYASLNYLTKDLKPLVETDDYPTVVMRPDSGNPKEVLAKILDIIEKNEVAFYINSKGFKVLKKYRVIWGDGVNKNSIQEMLDVLINRKYSSENITFGSGGWIMQQCNRDDLGFAYKCSAIRINNEWYDVYKDPVTDQNKRSKGGRLETPDMIQVY